MLGRRKGVPLADGAGDAYLRANGSQDDLLQATQSSAQLRAASEGGYSGASFFRRGQPYEGLSEGPPSPAANGAHAAPDGQDPETSARSSDDGETPGPPRGLFSSLSLGEKKRVYMPMTSALSGGGGWSGGEASSSAPSAAEKQRRGGGKPGSGAAAAAPSGKASRAAANGAGQEEDSTRAAQAQRAAAGAGKRAAAAAAAEGKGAVTPPGPPQPRPSPSLMSSAVKLAASIQQGSKRTLLRRKSEDAFEPLEDSATEDAASEALETPRGGGGSSAGSPRQPAPRRHSSGPSQASPGHRRPLLDSADGYEARSSGRAEPPLQAPGSRRQSAAGAAAAAARDAAPDGVGEAAAFDIFEPRPPPASPRTPAPAAAAAAGEHRRQRSGRAAAASPSLQEVQAMKGHEALEALRQGALLRKKWLGSPAPAAAAAAAKTERFIRVCTEDGRVVLHYHHQGVKGLLEKEAVSAAVQRVEVQDGPWRRGDCLLLHTARGVLALEAPDAATHATWMLGLNAALGSCQTPRRDALLEAPVRAIPRNAMFVVTPQ